MKKRVLFLMIVLGLILGTSIISSALYLDGQRRFDGDSFTHSFGIRRATDNFGTIISNHNLGRVGNTRNFSVAGREFEVEHNEFEAGNHLFEVDRNPSKVGSHPIGIEHHPFFEEPFSFSLFGSSPFFFSPVVFTPFVFSPIVSDPLFFNSFLGINFGFVR